MNQLREFGMRHDLVISSPDKGNGVVLVDKSRYIASMMKLLQDRTKFERINEPISQVCRTVEDRINRFLLKMKNQNTLNEATYSDLHVSGSGPGLLYGKPKIHKPNFHENFPYRPILAAYNLASYNLAKFLVPILSPITTNQYTIQNSKFFADTIQSLPQAEGVFMVSFDVENLFTNIPLSETIAIILQKLFPSLNSISSGFTRSSFKTLLELAVNNTYFLFNQCFYRQTEGMGMGSPLGPTFANIFMCNFEERWLNACPLEFKPLQYYRYIDDTFLLFNREHHAEAFLNYLNSKHPAIRFTMEKEQKGRLPFLDVNVRRTAEGFSTSVFRKPTFSGLGTSFFSHCAKKFKVNAIRTLIHRAHYVSSTLRSFCMEISFLKSFFFINGYPRALVDHQVELFLNKKLDFSPTFLTAPRKPFYFKLPYFGHKSVQLAIQISKVISENYFHLDPKSILINNSSIGNFFPYKDKLPLFLRSSVIYQYSCPLGCGSAYVGSTIRTLETRIAEHKGVSVRTNRVQASQKASSIRAHHSSSSQCDASISDDNFIVLDSSRNPTSLRILESLYILKTKPNLNEMSAAFPLKIVNY